MRRFILDSDVDFGMESKYDPQFKTLNDIVKGYSVSLIKPIVNLLNLFLLLLDYIIGYESKIRNLDDTMKGTVYIHL